MNRLSLMYRWPRRAFHSSPVSRLAAPQVQLKAKLRLSEIDAIDPFSPALVDSFSRKHDYLRISLTERCNLRCFYCMPSEGIELTPSPHLLSDDEIIRLATLFVRSGVTKIRLTGGEPTVRKGLIDLVGRLNELKSSGLKSIAMTTNGLALHRKLPALIENGLSHLNLSLDTLDPFKFELITRRNGHDAVLKSLDVALASRLQSIKVNVVMMKDLNESEVLDFVEMTKEQPISVRFIEFMPFTGNKWDKRKMVPSAELISRIKQAHPTVQRISDEHNDTARSWAIPGYKGSFGFISSMSDHFCSSCNRLRITADGQIKVCLFDSKEVSLRDKMRAGISDDDLLEVIGTAVQNKKEKHAGMEDIDVIHNRPMILIGGSKPKLGLRVFNSGPTPYFLLPPNLSPSTSSSVRLMSTSPPFKLTHVDGSGKPSMVDVSNKESTKRVATARGRIHIPPVAYRLLTETPEPLIDGSTDSSIQELEQKKAKARAKGDVLVVAQLAGIMASKKTSDLIPLCHPLNLSHVSVTLSLQEPELGNKSSTSPTSVSENNLTSYSILCEATATCQGNTGVEMEALTAVSVSLLTVWDMLKAVAGREMRIGNIHVSSKAGGKSGDFERIE